MILRARLINPLYQCIDNLFSFRSGLGHLANERRLSANTILNYRRDVAALIEAAAGAPLATLHIHHLRRFVAQLHARGLDGRTLARMLSAWRGFYRYLARDHGYANNPCSGLRAPRAKKSLPHALSPDEAAQMMNIADDDVNRCRFLFVPMNG